MKKLPEPRKINPHHVQGISFNNADLLSEAKERARSLGLSLSNYVTQLVREDLARGGPFQITPPPSKAPNPTRAKVKSRPIPSIKRGTNLNGVIPHQTHPQRTRALDE